jgi:DNA replication protein DnaC
MYSSIQDKFSSLRLYGASKAFGEQVSNSGFHEMSFEERLSLLLEREEIERANKAMCARIGKAKFRQQASFDDIKSSAARGLDKPTLQSLGTCEWVRKKKNLIITGPSGCGKTFLSTAVCHRACLMGLTARYFRASNLLGELEVAREEGKLGRLLKQLSKPNVLIIDDFMLAAINETEQKNLFEVIEERHESSTTLFTSQNPVSLWHALMPNPAIADAILDRIANGSLRIELKGESMRRKKVAELDQPEEVRH